MSPSPIRLELAALRLGREPCPCCGYPTLERVAALDICELCDWQDDGQDDEDAGVVRGTWNGDLSLARARDHYHRYGTMYPPDADTRHPPGDTLVTVGARERLVEAFAELEGTACEQRLAQLRRCVAREERLLLAELDRVLEQEERRLQAPT